MSDFVINMRWKTNTLRIHVEHRTQDRAMATSQNLTVFIKKGRFFKVEGRA